MAKRKYQTQREAGIILAVCGVISGLLSASIDVDFLSLFDVPMLPAVFFGIVIALGIYSWEARHPAPIVIALIGVAIAWWVAVKTGTTIYEGLEKSRATFAYAGILAGLVGALLVSITLWITSEDFRSLRNLITTAVFGAVAGALLAFSSSSATPAGLVPLFVIWQAGIAGIVGYALAFRPQPSS
ncbi:MAG: hypothetical protein KF794_03980 [Xanthobacteraceae bacterium]|nr:hypothetical protein [Xanthobacteraceae bacterium]QYK45861.1 MAG: hypothetical protein KF794_03980 [Xanthobacteraceae bacterium]